MRGTTALLSHQSQIRTNIIIAKVLRRRDHTATEDEGDCITLVTSTLPVSSTRLTTRDITASREILTEILEAATAAQASRWRPLVVLDKPPCTHCNFEDRQS